MFLGTISKRTKLTEIAIFAPLWDYGISTEGCGSYCDVNLYDDEGERPEYLSFSKLTSGENVGFINSTTIHIDWKYIFQSDINPSTPTDKYFEYNPANDWVFEAGFYPRLQMTKNNLTYCNGDLWQNHDKDYAYSNDNDYLIHMYDFVIDNAFYECILDKDGTVEDALHTPKLFPAYAWLASVPAFTHNGQLAYYLDTSISLANKTQRMDQNTQNVAHYSLSENQTVMDVSGSTATPKVNAKGDVMLTITSADNISKQLLLNVNNSRTWDEKVAVFYDRGDGTAASPYEIHNARQLILAFISNNKDEHYKLVNDIWFNENLLTNTGEPKEGCSKWNHLSKRDTNHWKAHLDGDGHLVHGLYSTNAFGLVETMEVEASIENTGFVDCLVWSPETEDTDDGSSNRPLAFLSPSIETGVLIRNCLFDGVLYERRQIGSGHMGGLLHTAKNQSKPYVEDCVVAFSSRVKDNQYHPSHSLFASIPDFADMPNFAQRVLVLNNNLSFMDFVPTSDDIGYTDCYFPHGYLKTSSGDSYNYTRCPKTVDEMTDGKFFTGEGFDKWTAKEGRFPMLTTFAGTAYGKLISLPVYTDKDNRFDDMNYLMDFTPSVAKWTTTNENVIGIDTDIRVLEPKTANSYVYLVRSMEDAKIITPIKTAAEITKGIKFEDEEAKKFCLVYYDSNNDGAISLQELKAVKLETFEANMNKNDNNPNDNDGDLISAFPEFRYFAGISDLGTSFQDKEKLRTLDFSNKITELSDDDFKGNTSMESFTIPVSVGTVSGQAFYNSGLENYYVETDHKKFTATDGVLYDMSQETLLSYPNGRKNTSIEITDNVKTIGSKAVYKMAEVDTVIINAADYDYETVVKLEENAITAADGKQLLFLIEDGTQELSVDELEARAYSSRRAGTVDHRGKGALLSKYQESDFWIGKNLESFIYLDISDKSKDSEGNYWATLYCGFDTELPDYMTPYIVDKEKT
ncbi:MAG: leucine-rich repeat protein, partial [Prevotella sp.]|nr:leucine-rich repeat protein [Prevotella sp.]